ncbi:Lactose transport system permease protein LacF [subsurface metagenome]
MRRKIIGYLFPLPLLILILVIFLYPLLSTVRYSLYDIPFGVKEGPFVGLRNYRIIFGEPVFWQGFKNSIIWALGNLALQLTIPFGIAIVLNHRLRGINFVRATVLIPWIVPAVVVSICARWLLLPTMGPINHYLIKAGIITRRLNFLGSLELAMPTLIALNSWKFFPFGTLLILAALQTIPVELYEAARVDGANPWQCFTRITFPLVGKMVWFIGFLVFVWNYNIFDLIWLTTKGGPGNTTQTLPVLIYRRAFKTFRPGEASSIAVIIVIFLAALGLVYFKLLAPKKEERVIV